MRRVISLLSTQICVLQKTTHQRMSTVTVRIPKEQTRTKRYCSNSTNFRVYLFLRGRKIGHFVSIEFSRNLPNFLYFSRFIILNVFFPCDKIKLFDILRYHFYCFVLRKASVYIVWAPPSTKLLTISISLYRIVYVDPNLLQRIWTLRCLVLTRFSSLFLFDDW